MQTKENDRPEHSLSAQEIFSLGIAVYNGFLSESQLVFSLCGNQSQTYAVRPRIQFVDPFGLMCKINQDVSGSKRRNRHHRNVLQRNLMQPSSPSWRIDHSKIGELITSCKVLTLFSGDHTLVILSMPTAANFFPSQFQATWVMACELGIR